MEEIKGKKEQIEEQIIKARKTLKEEGIPEQPEEEYKKKLLEEVMLWATFGIFYNLSVTVCDVVEYFRSGACKEFDEDFFKRNKLFVAKQIRPIREKMWYMDFCRERGEEISYNDFVKIIFDEYNFDSESESFIEEFIRELCLSQKRNGKELDIRDIAYLGSGNFSRVLGVGDCVLKVGKGRKTSKIPWHERILRPSFRMYVKTPMVSINSDSDEFEEEPFIEIQQVVNTKWYEDLGYKEIEEKLYEIYKELRSKRYYMDRYKRR